jgi:UDP-N-acetylglucosamine 4,6-dehydratase
VLKGSRILVTGGTGSFGNAFIERLLDREDVGEIVVFSRDEFKQHQMGQKWPDKQYPIRYFLGDIRDKERLLRAFTGIDYVVHAAALKHVPALEANPFEAVRTNVLGVQNVIEAALERSVKRVVVISTDKAVSPVNLYGATKLVMEKLTIAANAYVRYRDVRFSVVRYGNVVGSRGSVIPLFADMIAKGRCELPVTDPSMTRFWITLDQGVDLVLTALNEALAGETFVPKIPSMSMTSLVDAMPQACTMRVVGRRPVVKIHEMLISESEGERTLDHGAYYIITPEDPDHAVRGLGPDCSSVPSGFSYESDKNSAWVTAAQMRAMLQRMTAADS